MVTTWKRVAANAGISGAMLGLLYVLRGTLRELSECGLVVCLTAVLCITVLQDLILFYRSPRER